MPATIRCLLIGLPQAMPGDLDVRPDEMQTLHIADIRSDAALPKGLELIITPLFRPEFDALEVIELIAKRGYHGKLRVVAKALPNRSLVLRELRAHASRRKVEVELVDEA